LADRDAIEKALAAVNEASGQVAAIWVTLLLFATYLAIAVGATTHEDLLLESPIRLPLLNVELGLFTFYWAAPLLFLVFHLYFLVQLYALAGKVHAFNALLARGLAQGDRLALRRRLHVFMLTQALAGPARGPVPRLLLRLTMWLTAVLGPVVLLLLFQLRFLPYHSEAMTWWHRAAVLLDLLLLWALWPLILHPSGAMRPFLGDLFGRLLMLPARVYAQTRTRAVQLLHRLRQGPDRWRALLEMWRWQESLQREARSAAQAVQGAAILLFASAGVVAFALLVATIPDEPIERWIVAVAAAAEEHAADCRAAPATPETAEPGSSEQPPARRPNSAQRSCPSPSTSGGC
jgi:hypothetical protein